tara:strand:+ start:2428 stop:2667 length:240 start_codon:yes stop_codon:yes gene_type:complete
MKFPVIFRTPSLLIPGLGHWEKLDREPLDHAFWLFPAEAYRTYAGGIYPLPLRERHRDWPPMKAKGKSTNHSFLRRGRR